MLHSNSGRTPESKQVAFDDLPDVPNSEAYEPRDFIVWRKPTMFQKDVARPQSMRDPSLPEVVPPVSMLFETFAQQVDRVEKSKLLLS
jgi:hypothetical protein